jgi:anti-sigma-K factor RskA
VLELPARGRPAWSTWALAAAAVVLAVSAAALWITADRLRGELAGTRERLAQAERDLAIERSWAAVAASPGARVVDLAPVVGGVQLPRVRATYDPGSRRAIIAFEGLSTPAGSDFELWAILPDGPKSLGVVRGDAGGKAEVRVPDAGDPASLAAFALSLEREGGSPDKRKPAGPVVLAGSVKG